RVPVHEDRVEVRVSGHVDELQRRRVAREELERKRILEAPIALAEEQEGREDAHDEDVQRSISIDVSDGREPTGRERVLRQVREARESERAVAVAEEHGYLPGAGGEHVQLPVPVDVTEEELGWLVGHRKGGHAVEGTVAALRVDESLADRAIEGDD